MLNDSLLRKEIKNDADMKQKTILIVEKLSSFYSSEANEKVLLAVLKTQRLVKEIFKDGD